MSFEKYKQNALTKTDKSVKRSIDKDISELVELINSKPDYYTTSSCSGRILLLSHPEKNRKYNVDLLFLSHNEITFKIIKDNLDKIMNDFRKNNIKRDLWFKEESAIMHICCKTLEDASNLIETAKHIGFKRSGINTMKNKIILEILSTENMDVPIVKNGELIVNDDYLRIIINEANDKLKKTKEKIKEFYNELSS